MKINKNLDHSQRFYLKIAKFRDLILRPLLRFLSWLHITPNMLTYSEIIIMFLFILFIQKNLILSSIFLLLAILFDSIDGPLARFQKIDSDKGKFIDVFIDILVFVMFIWGLIYANLLNELIGSILIFTLPFSRIFRIIYNNQFLKSDWLFKAWAGFIPTLITDLSYINFFIYILFKQNYFFEVSIIFSIILFVDIIIFYYKVIKIK